MILKKSILRDLIGLGIVISSRCHPFKPLSFNRVTFDVPQVEEDSTQTRVSALDLSLSQRPLWSLSEFDWRNYTEFVCHTTKLDQNSDLKSQNLSYAASFGLFLYSPWSESSISDMVSPELYVNRLAAKSTLFPGILDPPQGVQLYSFEFDCALQGC